MKNRTSICITANKLFGVVIATLFLSGCSNGRNVGVTNMEQPGPVIGRAVGGGVGAVAGNVAGAGVGVVEGASSGIHSAFDNTQRVARYWKEEKTADGRTIMVQENYLVDANGQIIRKVQ
jgi:outer membrane lipoprotein SlyB